MRLVDHRMRLPEGTPLEPLNDLCDGVTAGLAEHLDEVQAIDAVAEAGEAWLLHAAVDSDGTPLTVESRVSTEVHCRLFPTTGADQPLAVEIDLAGAVEGRVERYGPHARMNGVPLRASAAPGWLFAFMRLGPRPKPVFEGIALATVDAGHRRITLTWSAGVITEPDRDVDLTATGRLDIIDGGEGLWLASPVPPELREDDVPADAEVLRPTTPAALWDTLVLLLA